MFKTNLILFAVLAALSGLSYLTWIDDSDDPTEARAEEAAKELISPFVVDLPRENSLPRLDRVERIKIRPPRIDVDKPVSPATRDRELLRGDLPNVIWDMLTPSDRERLHSGTGEPPYFTLPAVEALLRLQFRTVGIAFDPRRNVLGDDACLWGEFGALRNAPEFSELRPQQDPRTRQLRIAPMPKVEIYFQQLGGVRQQLFTAQSGRVGGGFTFGELNAAQFQMAKEALIQSVVALENLQTPWRRPFRHLEELLGGKARTGFEGYGALAWCAEIEERLAQIEELAGAEVLDHPNPREWSSQRDRILAVLRGFGAKLPEWRASAETLHARRAALRIAFAALPDPSRRVLLQPIGNPPQGFIFQQSVLPVGVSPEQRQAAEAFLKELKALEESLRALKVAIFKAAQPLATLPEQVEELLRATPREIVLERDPTGRWLIASEGGFPAWAERIDGAEITVPRAPGLTPWSAFTALYDRARNAAAEMQLTRGGGQPRFGGAPLLVALAELKTNDPRGAWLPREREYGFDESALEIELQGANERLLDQVRFGKSPDDAGGVDRRPPWERERANNQQNPRDMAYVHSLAAARRQAFRVEFAPGLSSLRPRSAVMRTEFFAGNRRVVDLMGPDKVAVLELVERQGTRYRVERAGDERGAGERWRLERIGADGAVEELGAMDQGVARRIVSELTSASFEGVAAQVVAGDAQWKRFGFDEPQHSIAIRGAEYDGRLLVGGPVRRDGELYIVATLLGGKLDGRPRSDPHVFLLARNSLDRLEQGVQGLEDEARLLSAGPILDAVDWSALQRIAIVEGSAGEGPLRALNLERGTGPGGETRWTLPGLFDHPADAGRLRAEGGGLLGRLEGLQRSYPLEQLSDAQRQALDQKFAGATRISFYLEGAESPAAVLALAADEPSVTGGQRVSNNRREGPRSIVRIEGEEEIYLVPALDFPDLGAEYWMDVDWRAGQASIKAAVALRASGTHFGADEALDLVAEGPAGARVWRRAAGAGELSQEVVEKLLGLVETIGPLNVERVLEEDLAEDDPLRPENVWIALEWSAAGGAEQRLSIARRQEGEQAVYTALLPGRAFVYRISPVVVDPLVATLDSLRGGE